MKPFRWSEKKERALIRERNVSFEVVTLLISQGHVLDVVEHPNQTKYKGQGIFVVEINRYAYLVPFVETENERFLKTIIPSRKATRRYLKQRRGENGEAES